MFLDSQLNPLYVANYATRLEPGDGVGNAVNVSLDVLFSDQDVEWNQVQDVVRSHLYAAGGLLGVYNVKPLPHFCDAPLGGTAELGESESSCKDVDSTFVCSWLIDAAYVSSAKPGNMENEK